MPFHVMDTTGLNGGPYYVVPVPGTYPPQQVRMPVNSTPIANMPVHHPFPGPPVITTPWVVYSNAPTPHRQPHIYYHAVSIFHEHWAELASQPATCGMY